MKHAECPSCANSTVGCELHWWQGQLAEYRSDGTVHPNARTRLRQLTDPTIEQPWWWPA